MIPQSRKRSHKIIMHGKILLLILILLSNTCLFLAAAGFSQSTSGEGAASDPAVVRSKTGSHTVFAEYFTTEWCVYCPSASKALKNIYDSQDYDFYFVSMILEDKGQNTTSEDGKDRADDFALMGYPTVEFDGGYMEVTGNQTDESNYINAIETSIDREIPDIDIYLSTNHKGEAKLEISVEVINNEDSSYSGTLRVYIVEIISRYLNYDGEHSTYGFLDFAIEKDIDISAGQSSTESTTWDGAQVTDGLGNDFSDIEPDNIIVFATMSNGDRATALERKPQSSKAINLYCIDETAAAYPTGGSPKDTKEPTAPSSNEELNGLVRIEANVEDDGTILNVEYQIDKNNIWTRMFPEGSIENQYFAFWDTDIVENEQHEITVRAIDLGNNKAEDSVFVSVLNFASDNSKPEITFKDFDEGQEIRASVSFTIEVFDDSGINSVKFNIDDGKWRDMETKEYNKYTGVINTTDFSDGEHSLNIKAEDKAGNIETKSITFQIKNNPSNDSKGSSIIPGFEMIILIGAIAVFMVYFSKYLKEDK